MDILKTGIGITKTFKNMGRAREIINVFWANGFEEFILKSDVVDKIPGISGRKKKIERSLEYQSEDIVSSVGYRLRKSFEELGPSFIKLGQLLSTREDIFDEKLIKELKKLQDSASPLSLDEVSGIIKTELGCEIDEIFSELNPKPIGTASIGVAFKGKLKTGEDIVLKVRRPGIKKIINNDFEIIKFLIDQAEKYSAEFQYLGMRKAVQDFFQSMQGELNYLVEAKSCQKLARNLQSKDEKGLLTLPKIYEQYCTESILCMELLDGVPFNKLPKTSLDESLALKLSQSVNLFTQTLLSDGFFHADLHGGNFFLLNDGKIGIIDFGLMGYLTRKNRIRIVAMLVAIINNDYENLIYEFLDVASYDKIPSTDELTADLQTALTPFIGMSVSEIDSTGFVHAIFNTLRKHKMFLPQEWFIIFRALITLDGVGKSIGYDVNVFDVLESQIEDISKSLINKDELLKESAWISKDLIGTLRVLPRHLKWFLRETSKKNYQLDLKLVGIEDNLHKLSQSIFFVGTTLVAIAFFYFGVLQFEGVYIYHITQIPILSWIFWSLGTLFLLRAGKFQKK